MVSRLYHSYYSKLVGSFSGIKSILAWLVLACFLFFSCSAPQATQGQITISIYSDGKDFQVQLPSGSKAQDALTKTGITVTALDRSEPPLYTVLSNGSRVRVVRVKEEFEIEQVVIPFERQVLQNESLPEGETRLSQPGANGLQETTYRRVLEDGVEVSRSVVKSVIVKDPVPEIVMVGSQTPFLSLPIPGRLVYLSAGNAWVMEKTTGNRRPLVTTGDLDGRVFSLSPDEKWLLYSRNTSDEATINTLWAARVEGDSEVNADFKVSNIIHFAQFGPDSNTVAYSTVEPRSTAPGWQANNDLNLVGVSSSGFVSRGRTALETNSGGVYGWWGMNFSWGPGKSLLAYARPDSVGLFDIGIDTSTLTPLLDILPVQTGGDWAWVPGINWGPDGKTLFTVSHNAPPGSSTPEESQQFDLVAIPLTGGTPVKIVSQVGMFAYPVSSPLQTSKLGETSEKGYQVAYLQAIFPAQSETSRYRLVVMDRDGSNQRVLFPNEGSPGLNPQKVVWSPKSVNEKGSYMIAFINQGNIWLVNLDEGQVQQITGDGLITQIDWR